VAKNIEIKAEVDSFAALLPAVAALAEQGPFELDQDDTFFVCSTGRLKLRAFSPVQGELIYYRRPDQKGPRESFYLVAATAAPDLMREMLTQAYGQCGRVRKHRTLFLIGQTRIHLDRVDGLGNFLELEVVIGDSVSSQEGAVIAQAIMAKLGIDSSRLVDVAYVDLLSDRISQEKK